jgi:hypothetical protein
MPEDAQAATSNSASTDQSQSPAGDQQSHQAEPVSISASQSKFAGLASRFFGRPVHVEDGADGDGEQGETKDGETRTGDQKTAATDEKVTLTKEELRRMVQSEKDKELARADKAQKDQAEAARLEKLKKEDPYAYIEQDEAAKETGKFVATIATTYDQTFLDPIKERLAEKDREALLGKGVVGLEGRKEFVNKALDMLLKQAEARGAKTAEAKIRGNKALLKQTLVGERDTADEPDLVEGSGVPAASTKVDMNLLLRRAAGH